DSQSTESQRYHGGFVTGETRSRLTDIAPRCPAAVACLESLIDVTACWRARFMLSEPGAVVPAHRDVSEGPAVVLYLSIHQPAGCDYLIDLNEDGSRNPITRVVPITSGSSY